jgi:hypothetical protein
MVGEKQFFWDRIFSIHHSDREEEVLEHVIHHLEDGADLEVVVREEYVRRHASPDGVQEILDSPRLVKAIQEKM